MQVPPHLLDRLDTNANQFPRLQETVVGLGHVVDELVLNRRQTVARRRYTLDRRLLLRQSPPTRIEAMLDANLRVKIVDRLGMVEILV